MVSFLNSATAIEDEKQAHLQELTQARAERDLALLRVQAMEALLKAYLNRIVELEMKIALTEINANNGS